MHRISGAQAFRHVYHFILCKHLWYLYPKSKFASQINFTRSASRTRIIGFASQINFTRSASRTRIIGFASQINFTRSASRTRIIEIQMNLFTKNALAFYILYQTSDKKATVFTTDTFYRHFLPTLFTGIFYHRQAARLTIKRNHHGPPLSLFSPQSLRHTFFHDHMQAAQGNRRRDPGKHRQYDPHRQQ